MNKRNILEYLEATALRYPDKVAISDGARSLTFSELQKRAMAIGSGLCAKGFYRQAIAILMDKHPDTVCAFLGALYAGCFYVCIDPEFPDERIRALAEKCRAAAVICNADSRERSRVLYGRAEILPFEDMAECVIDRAALLHIRETATDTDVAYVVFTSGSSGEPKGVCSTHRAIIDYGEALCATLGFDGESVFGNQAPLYYDAPLKELLPMLMLGASVVLIPKGLFMFPTRLCEFIREQEINTLCWAASALARVSALGTLDLCDMSGVRLVCHGSEVFARGEYEKWRRACPRARFINLYGPTEATGMSAYWVADRELASDEPIPIGRAFPNTEILLIDEDGKLCADGEVGEIYIRGTCLSLGYFGDVEQTRAAFVQNPLHDDYPETLYRTGDMARRNEYGELVFLGRRDSQIKRSGRRIEPCEVEAVAERSVGVSQSALIYDRESERIVLFYVGDADERQVRSELSLRLPRYMLPNRLCRLESMPQKENGKLDRTALLALLKGMKGGETACID